jgi:excisionase family DNA binding protein
VTKDPRSYTTIAVAQRLGVSLQTVQRWVDAGHLKAWKTLGGHRRIDATSAERLFREQDDRLGAAAPAAHEPAAAPRVSVVVVDDDPMDRALLVMLVQKALPDATVEAAANGFQGLMVIGKLAPRIVVTDILMPNIDGFEMIRTLLEDAASNPRTLIAVSALSRQDLSRLGTLPPGVQLFTKPLAQDRFVDAVRKAR